MEKTKKRKLNISFNSDIDLQTDSPETKDSESSGKSKSSNSSKGQLWEFIALATIPIVLVFGNSMLVPGLPAVQRELGICKFLSSLILTVFSLAAGLVFPS
ncbi:MFS transporter, partial [Clostridium perfringens]